MSVSPAYREKLYRAYMEFFELAERKRRWNLFSDIPWEKLDASRNTETTAVSVETFCGVELYVPDYTAAGFGLHRDVFGAAWFQANWGYEESKHALVFREYLVRSGLRTEAQYAAFERQIFDRVWTLPYPTIRQMACYGLIQELTTHLIYRHQMERARRDGDPVLEKIYFYVSRDEAAHADFYRKGVEFDMEEDREGTLGDLAEVAFDFRMPGLKLIPEYAERLKVDGVGITSQQFLQEAVFPILRKLGTSRVELVRAYRRRTEAARAARPDAGALEARPDSVPVAAG